MANRMSHNGEPRKHILTSSAKTVSNSASTTYRVTGRSSPHHKGSIHFCCPTRVFLLYCNAVCLFFTALPQKRNLVRHAGLVFPGLFHASDWLPTIMEGLLEAKVKAFRCELLHLLALKLSKDSKLACPCSPCEGTKPLDGLNLWPALAQNASSPRSDIFYGIAEPRLTD